MPNDVSFFAINADDVPRARQFYSAVFGWKFEPWGPPGFYLIGLSNLDQDKERNLQLLKERGWFDVPVVYGNNRRAILAVEKGTPGERAFADAFKAWKQ